MKILKWVGNNIFFLITLFLLAFIPLYPKLPLIDIKNTWVYVRAEDFLVVITMALWALLLFKKKISFKTPLTAPILIFWIMGGIATIHAVILIFPGLMGVFPNVAFLSFLRRVEYMSLFFVAYVAMKDKQMLRYVIFVLVATLLLVCAYGFGQKYLDFPAYLTMNEEFAKGIPIRLSQLSRVPSTFGGHYDLAAYLVLVIPIVASLIFGFRNWLIRLVLVGSVGVGFVVLFMTVSRVSFFVLIISLIVVLFFQMKKFVIISVPIVLIIGSILFINFAPSLSDRFGNTLKEIDVLVDAKTGAEIGHAQIVSSDEFKDLVIQKEIYESGNIADVPIRPHGDLLSASPSAIHVFYSPAKVLRVVAPNTPTGENLPQGTGYINLTLSPVTQQLGQFFYEKPVPQPSTESARAFAFSGDFLLKKAAAYDLSFTTRYQGEWPHAIEAFKRNILFGSGYSSVSLAVDNNYLRILAETGLVGFFAFLGIFIIAGIYIAKLLPKVHSPVERSFVYGFVAGVFGLALNAVLIDVFEASKIAFLLWLLTGITLGFLTLYQKEPIDILAQLKKVLASRYAVIAYLFIITFFLFSPLINNFFVGDDFTWLRWAADCGKGECPSILSRIGQYFTDANGFFYRPGTKVYFLLMYSTFWLNQTVYHTVSIGLHLIMAILVFFLAKKVFEDFKLSALCAFLFLLLSSHAESIFWISSTGHLINAVFILLSLLFYIAWEKQKKIMYFVFAIMSMIISLLFHELGIIVPLLIIAYKITIGDTPIGTAIKNKFILCFFLPDILYLLLRLAAKSHWFNGDYSYNIIKLPFNFAGNGLGYFMVSVLGPISLPFYSQLRTVLRDQIVISAIAGIIILVIAVFLYKMFIRKMDQHSKRIVGFSFLFFIVSLLPFLGLGNLAARYSYLASIGVVFLVVFFINVLYKNLQSQGKFVSQCVIGFILVSFCLFQIMQIQQAHSNWYEAGKKVTTFFRSIDSYYSEAWSKKAAEIHFAQVPLQVGDAWVFPVGLSDALWLVFRNQNLKVYEWPNVKDSLEVYTGNINQRVFVFNDSGEVTEIVNLIK